MAEQQVTVQEEADPRIASLVSRVGRAPGRPQVAGLEKASLLVVLYPLGWMIRLDYDIERLGKKGRRTVMLAFRPDEPADKVASLLTTTLVNNELL